ncbi:MAG: sigma-70 family RNA polymerase sigma factor, partial [Candidatus Marinimicrobia bacterium]|nr:sigma-70 family RNA polymerase sigma factor [Candidatus Neomarinimicrobiota bacterium]
ERKLMDSTAKIEIDKALNRLPKRDSDIVRLYYGIGVDQVMTLEEIGKKFNLTRERVRQIKARAILRLRGLISSQTLRSIMNN